MYRAVIKDIKTICMSGRRFLANMGYNSGKLVIKMKEYGEGVATSCDQGQL